MLDDFDLDIPEEEFDEEGEGAPRSRTFMMIAGGLGAVIIIAVICIGAWWFMNREDPAVAAQSQTQTVIAQNAATDQARTETAIALMPTDTPTSTPTDTPTPEPTATPTEPGIPTMTATLEGGPTADPRTATVRALLTQAAQAQTQAAEALLTVSPTPTPDGLPDTGFIDDIGAPALFGMAALLIVVIFITRRLRAANA